MGRNEVHALSGIDLKIESGEMVAVMGASGSGKSTLMNVLGCLDAPSSGEYFLDGVRVNDLGKNRLADLRNQKLGFVFQGFNLLARTTALENVELPLLYDRSGRELDTRALAAQALARVGLAERADHQPSELSGGQQQRVAIARALVTHPALLLADEPTGNLDSRTTIEIMALFQELNDQGITVLVVTHEPDVAHYARRILEMRDGRIIRDVPVVDRGRAECRPAGARGWQRSSVMRKSALVRIATQSILKNKLRMFLTMLGIMIGVGAVIVMIAISSGAQSTIQKQVGNLGTNMLFIMPGASGQGGVSQGAGTFNRLTLQDAEKLKREATLLAAVSPVTFTGVQAISAQGNWRTRVNGVSTDFQTIRDWPVSSGVFFNDSDQRALRKVAVLGNTVAQNLYPGTDPVGQQIQLRDVPFKIIGVLSPKGQQFGGQDQDDVVIVPYTTVQARINNNARIGMILASTSVARRHPRGDGGNAGDHA